MQVENDEVQTYSSSYGILQSCVSSLFLILLEVRWVGRVWATFSCAQGLLLAGLGGPSTVLSIEPLLTEPFPLVLFFWFLVVLKNWDKSSCPRYKYFTEKYFQLYLLRQLKEKSKSFTGFTVFFFFLYTNILQSYELIRDLFNELKRLLPFVHRILHKASVLNFVLLVIWEKIWIVFLPMYQGLIIPCAVKQFPLLDS